MGSKYTVEFENTYCNYIHPKYKRFADLKTLRTNFEEFQMNVELFHSFNATSVDTFKIG